MNNQYKLHDRKRCTKMMPKEAKRRPNGIPRSNDNCKDGGSKRDRNVCRKYILKMSPAWTVKKLSEPPVNLVKANYSIHPPAHPRPTHVISGGPRSTPPPSDADRLGLYVHKRVDVLTRDDLLTRADLLTRLDNLTRTDNLTCVDVLSWKGNG